MDELEEAASLLGILVSVFYVAHFIKLNYFNAVLVKLKLYFPEHRQYFSVVVHFKQ